MKIKRIIFIFLILFMVFGVRLTEAKDCTTKRKWKYKRIEGGYVFKTSYVKILFDFKGNNWDLRPNGFLRSNCDKWCTEEFLPIGLICLDKGGLALGADVIDKLIKVIKILDNPELYAVAIKIAKMIIGKVLFNIKSEWEIEFESITARYSKPESKEFNGDVILIVDWKKGEISGIWGGLIITKGDLKSHSALINGMKYIQKWLGRSIYFKYKCKNCVVPYKRSCCNIHKY